MEALNKKERNAAIIRFSFWFALCLGMVSLPVVMITHVPKTQINELRKAGESLTKKMVFDRDTFAAEIQSVIAIMNKYEGRGGIDEKDNLKLINIIEGIKKKTENKKDEDSLYHNVTSIAEFIINANRTNVGANEKQKEVEDLLKEAEKKTSENKKDLKGIISEFDNVAKDLDAIHNKRVFDCKDATKVAKRKFDEAFDKLKNFKEDL